MHPRAFYIEMEPTPSVVDACDPILCEDTRHGGSGRDKDDCTLPPSAEVLTLVFGRCMPIVGFTV